MSDKATARLSVRVDMSLDAYEAHQRVAEALRYFAGLKDCDEDQAACQDYSGPYCSTHGDNFMHRDEITEARAALAELDKAKK